MLPILFNENLLKNFDLFNNSFENVKTNIVENEKSYDIELSSPGISKENCEVSINDNNLSIKIEYKNEEKVEKKNYLKQEFSYMNYSKQYIIPENTDAENISANVSNGVLKIEIPKVKETKKNKIVEIK